MSSQGIWDYWAKGYEKLWVQKYSLGPTREKILHYLRETLEQTKSYRILDIGCGTGQLLREIRKEFPGYQLELLGIDYAEQMIQLAQEHGVCDTLNQHPQAIAYQQMDVRDISSIQENFDIIICTHSFPYYKDQGKVISDIRDLLVQGGYLLLAQASQNNFYDQVVMSLVKLTTGKANYLSVQEVKHLTKDYFQSVELVKIKEKLYMPSIYLFVLKLGKV